MKKILSILLVFSFSTVAIGFWGDDSLKATGALDQYELAVCSVNTNIKNNPTYYQLASVNTNLLCDIGANNRIGTFEAFYNNGWRLIQVVNVDSRLATKNNTVPYALIYLERIKKPTIKQGSR